MVGAEDFWRSGAGPCKTPGQNNSVVRKSGRARAVAKSRAGLFLGTKFQFIGPVGLPVVMKSYRINLGYASSGRQFMFRTLVIVDAARELDCLSSANSIGYFWDFMPRDGGFHKTRVAFAPDHQLAIADGASVDGRLRLPGEKMLSRHAGSK